MHVCHAPAACKQGAHVTASLGAMQLPERPAHLRDRDVLVDIGGNDQKEPGVGAAFV